MEVETADLEKQRWLPFLPLWSTGAADVLAKLSNNCPSAGLGLALVCPQVYFDSRSVAKPGCKLRQPVINEP